MKLSIIVPAHNEEKRIERTLRAYHKFFIQKKQKELDVEIVVVLNGCTDNTLAIVNGIKAKFDKNIIIIDLHQAGKGLAIKAGFANALSRDNNLIGFVDADMATEPEAFFDLVQNINDYDGIVASRYMPGAQIFPPRPWWKRWGSILVYESLVWLLFGLRYYDLQCGAKLFKHEVLEKINPLFTIRQWAFDVELLYLCKKYGFTIKEHPTVWHDQANSKLTLRAGMRMLGSLFKLRLRYSPFQFLFRKRNEHLR